MLFNRTGGKGSLLISSVNTFLKAVMLNFAHRIQILAQNSEVCYGKN